MNKRENVKTQYANDKNLLVRVNLHAKHSTNKQGFVPWLFERYTFAEDYHILELGCGNGGQWSGRIEQLPAGCRLLLSDFSEGMVNTVREKYSPHDNVSFAQIDIQSIPFNADSFDIVIANHMLYHIPDLDKALSEVKRVLKPCGCFYCTTNGNGGMRVFLREAMKRYNLDTQVFIKDWSFSLQNGADLLERYLSSVERIDYEDSLAITETQDLIDWLMSTLSIASYSEENVRELYDYFEEIRVRDGTINIPKECGLFISKK
ncbi:MAG: class I SAM-dependent methyltransferase [Eubacteriales bacterium]|nr:class I SAM-dependent methyltransferase [Eubacteriales bacterium]